MNERKLGSNVSSQVSDGSSASHVPLDLEKLTHKVSDYQQL